jgi:hypothetical protein
VSTVGAVTVVFAVSTILVAAFAVSTVIVFTVVSTAGVVAFVVSAAGVVSAALLQEANVAAKATIAKIFFMRICFLKF